MTIRGQSGLTLGDGRLRLLCMTVRRTMCTYIGFVFASVTETTSLSFLAKGHSGILSVKESQRGKGNVALSRCIYEPSGVWQKYCLGCQAFIHVYGKMNLQLFCKKKKYMYFWQKMQIFIRNSGTLPLEVYH